VLALLAEGLIHSGIGERVWADAQDSRNPHPAHALRRPGTWRRSCSASTAAR
jgi:hypothetical protein